MGAALATEAVQYNRVVKLGLGKEPGVLRWKRRLLSAMALSSSAWEGNLLSIGWRDGDEGCE
eukprot:1032885-Pyramimonas_sp.AAC.1